MRQYIGAESKVVLRNLLSQKYSEVVVAISTITGFMSISTSSKN
jgi:hypothetical protein